MNALLKAKQEKEPIPAISYDEIKDNFRSATPFYIDRTDLSCTRLPNKFLRRLADVVKISHALKKLSLDISPETNYGDVEWKHTESVLSASKTITHLALTLCNASERAYDGIKEILARSTTIKKLDLILNLPSSSIMALIMENNSINTLHIRYLYQKMEDDSFRRILDTLSFKKAIKTIEFYEIKLNTAQKDVFIRELINNEANITSLTVEGCDLTDADLEQCKEALKTNKNLTSLSLARNELTGAVLGDILTTNNTLRTLQIKFNPLNPSLTELCTALKINQSLRLLDITHCAINATAIADLGATLKQNRSLETLRIMSPGVNIPLEPLFEGLKHNDTLTGLDIFLCGPNESIPWLGQLLQTNKTLTRFEGAFPLSEYPGIRASLERNFEERVRVVTSLMQFIAMMAKRPDLYWCGLPLEIWLAILRHIQVPGIDLADKFVSLLA